MGISRGRNPHHHVSDRANPVTRRLPSLLAAAALATALSAQPPAALESGFRNPPPSTRPSTFWQWMNGNVSRQGITLDLEAMKRVGIGGA
ncbi:MAG: hypothetical protein KGN36_17865, partial [Acidobacteriota bacterium]|nr:hypothetical protein [Acidobacteriota bacterium]